VANVTSSKKPKLWWQEGLFFFYNISSWIIGPLLLGIIIGKYIDSRFMSSPKYLIISIFVAFIITNIGLFLRVKEYSKKLSDQSKSEKHEQDSPQK
jgi:F0F1-type ATP synthase assembly protein I